MANLYQFPLDLASNAGEYPHRITFTALLSRNTSSTPVPGGMVALYLPPDALKTTYQQTYGDVDTGSLGMALQGQTGASAGRALAAMEGALSGEGGLMGALKSAGAATDMGQVGKAIATATIKEGIMKAGGPAGTAVQLLQKKVGKIMNPHKAVMYQGPGGFRTFSYSFTMSPQSADEALAVNNIVHFFKYHMHPGIPGSTNTGGRSAGARGGGRTGNTIGTSATLSYPEEFQIEMRVNNTDTGTISVDGSISRTKPLFKIGKCFLENISVDYSTSGGPAFFEDDGEPVTTTMSLQFKETVVMTKHTIQDGF